MTTARGATSRVTTEPAATNASSPISTPGVSVAPPPMRQARRSTGPRSGTPARVAVHRVVVGGRHARADEHVVLHHGGARQVDERLDRHPSPDPRIEVDRRAAAEHRALADDRSLSHLCLVADDHPGAEVRPGVDDGATADRHPVADLQRPKGSLGTGAGSQPGALAEHRAVLHEASLAEHDTGMQHGACSDHAPCADGHAVVNHDAGRERDVRGQRGSRRDKRRGRSSLQPAQGVDDALAGVTVAVELRAGAAAARAAARPAPRPRRGPPARSSRARPSRSTRCWRASSRRERRPGTPPSARHPSRSAPGGPGTAAR